MTPVDIRLLRDHDRRTYRKRVWFLVLYQIIVLGPVRIAIDTLLAHPWLSAYAYLKGYSILLMVGLVILIWVVGMRVIFARSY
jgi:hypothetical protein